MSKARALALRITPAASFEVVRMALVLGCAAALALAGLRLPV